MNEYVVIYFNPITETYKVSVTDNSYDETVFESEDEAWEDAEAIYVETGYPIITETSA